MVEVYGKEASGKTTLALHIIKEAQKLGGTVLESFILNTFVRIRTLGLSRIHPKLGTQIF